MALSEMLSSSEVVKTFEQAVIPNYTRSPICMVRGEGSYIWDAEGRRYLDLFPGWGCNLLGHCPPRIVEAVQEQVATLIHVPNNWVIESQGRWAQMLSERSFGGKAFFCNSGAEANEAAIKLARLHSGPQRYKVITFEGGFHGRTLATTTATAQPKFHEGLGPLIAGFSYAPFGDIEAVAELIDDATCAILVEPVQGEGGVRLPPEGFLEGLRKLADDHDLLLIFDEVQSGCGRSGDWFSYQKYGVTPDVMTLAKSLCGGVAAGAMLTTAEIAPSLRPGMHASTFGGNPIAARAGIATLEAIEQDNLLQNVSAMSTLFAQLLEPLVADFDFVSEVRVMGMMIGIELLVEGAPVVDCCLKKGLLINCTQGNVIRLLPAMNISAEQVKTGCEILADALKEISESTE